MWPSEFFSKGRNALKSVSTHWSMHCVQPNGSYLLTEQLCGRHHAEKPHSRKNQTHPMKINYIMWWKCHQAVTNWAHGTFKKFERLTNESDRGQWERAAGRRNGRVLGFTDSNESSLKRSEAIKTRSCLIVCFNALASIGTVWRLNRYNSRRHRTVGEGARLWGLESFQSVTGLSA